MSAPFIGTIQLFAFDYAPQGWATCDGQTLPISTNQALFALLGTQFGGDGRSTFKLPDLRGRTPTGFSSGVVIGVLGGEDTHTLAVSELPQHIHTLQADSTTDPASNTYIPSASVALGRSPAPLNIYNAPPVNGALASASIGMSGNSQAHDNMMPYLVMNYCIALTGIFPSRQ
jgi:microcystin-dependent protein